MRVLKSVFDLIINISFVWLVALVSLITPDIKCYMAVSMLDVVLSY